MRLNAVTADLYRSRSGLPNPGATPEPNFMPPTKSRRRRRLFTPPTSFGGCCPCPKTGYPQSFDHLPRLYDRFAELVSGDLHAYLKFRSPRAGGRAVDLGCGSGVHTALLAQHFTEVLAVDLSAPMLAYARQLRPRANVRYERRDLADVTPWRDGQFDFVLSAYTLHHVPDPELALLEMRRLVRPGGQLVVVDVVDDRH